MPTASGASIRVLGADSNRQVTIAAMILTYDDHSKTGGRVFDLFQSLGATIDLVEAPNNAQIRAAIRDFRRRTRSADVALIFIEGGLLMRGQTVFLAPQGVKIRRENDLLTRAVPLSALVRGVSTAAVGGAVFALDHVMDIGKDVRRYDGQPLSGNGTGTLVTIQEGFDLALTIAMQRFLKNPSIDLKEVIDFVSSLSGINASEMRLSIPLRREIKPESDESQPEAAINSEDQTDTSASDGSETTTGADTPVVKTYTMAELRTYQASLTPRQLKEIQASLKRFNHYRGVVDGILGKGTTRAIRHFQEARREDVTGYLTPRQHAELLK